MKSTRIQRRLGAVALLLVAATSACSAGGTTASGAKTIHVAAILELTGQFAGFGQQAKAGIAAAVSEENSQGHRAIDVTYYDCGSGAEACVNAARQAITQAGAQAVIGPIVSLDLIPTEAVTKQFGVPQLMVTVNKNLTQGFPNVFRFGNTEIANNTIQAKLIAGRIKPGQKVVIMAAANEFGQEAAANLSHELSSKYGVSVADTINIQLGQPDYTAAILKARSYNPSFVALYTQPAADVASILKGSRVLGLRTQFVMDANPDVAAVAGPASDGVIQAGPWFPIAGDKTDAAFVALAKKSAQITEPSWVTAMTHDATEALNDVVSKGATSGRQVVAALTMLSGFHGIAPSEGNFDSDRTYIRICQLAQIENGTYVAVSAP